MSDVAAGVHTVTAKGRVYHYHRATKTRLLEAPIGPDGRMSAELAKLNGLADVPPSPGTVGALFESYRGSAAFLDLRPATKVGYRKIMKVIEPIDRLKLEDLTPVYVAKMRDDCARKSGRRTANFMMAVLSVAAKHGIEQGYLKINPCRDVQRVKQARKVKKANRPWRPEELRAALEYMPPAVARVVALGMFTGLRRTDCVELPRTALQGAWLVRQTSKTGKTVRIPAHPTLLAMIEAAPAHKAKTLLANSHGKSWTVDGFATSFQKARNALEAKDLVGSGLTFHGLRHTVGAALRGITDDLDLIRRWLGQKTLTMAIHYSEGADVDAAMLDALGRFDPLGG